VTAVRLARPEDARGIAEVHVRSWQAGYRGIIRDAVLDTLTVDERERMWRGYLTDAANPISTLVATRDERVVGFVSLRDEGEIPALYVHPDAWRTGVGRALMDAALAELRGRDVFLWVLEENERGRAFYASYGFEPDGGRETNELGPEEIRVRLVSSRR